MKRPARRNLTLSLPEPLLRRFRRFAAKKHQSMSSLVAEAIQRILGDELARAVRARLIESMRNAPDRGTRGIISWTRDEIHER
jgi:RNase P/RNase MRP subunit POP5